MTGIANVPLRGAAVGISVVVLFALGGFAVSEYAAGERDCEQRKTGESLLSAIKADSSPSLAHLGLEGFCDDQTPFYGVTAQAGSTIGEARSNLMQLGCAESRRKPREASLDFDESAVLRMECSIPAFGAVLASLDPKGPLLSPQEFPGVRVFFAPVD